MDALKALMFGKGLFEYQLKPVELVWAGAIGLATFIVATPDSPSDWQAWVVAACAAAARPVFALVLGKRPQ